MGDLEREVQQKAAAIGILLMASILGGLWVGEHYGRAQGRAEQEAFDHANAPKPPLPAAVLTIDTFLPGMEGKAFYSKDGQEIYIQGVPESNGGDTSKTDVQRGKPHKAAPKAKAEYGCWRYLSTGKCIDGDTPTRGDKAAPKHPVPPITYPLYICDQNSPYWNGINCDTPTREKQPAPSADDKAKYDKCADKWTYVGELLAGASVTVDYEHCTITVDVPKAEDQ